MYDSRDLSVTKSENRVDNVVDIFQNSALLHEFIMKVVAGPSERHKRTFNDAFVTQTERPNYEYNEKTRLREPKNEFPRKRDSKAASLIKYFEGPRKLDRLSFDNR